MLDPYRHRKYKGAEDDTISVVVEGVLPYRTYGWRNDRSTEIVFDEYKQRKFGGDTYNGVKLTDEQNEFDLPGWAKLARKQTGAIGSGLEFQATKYVLDAPYPGVRRSSLAFPPAREVCDTTPV